MDVSKHNLKNTVIISMMTVVFTKTVFWKKMLKAEPTSNKQRPIRIHFHLQNRGLLIREKKT